VGSDGWRSSFGVHVNGVATEDVVRRLRGIARPYANRVRKRGREAYCPCCGTWQRGFDEIVLPDRQCWVCGSLERHRLLSILFAMRPDLLRPGMSVLHIAPEAQLTKRIRRGASRYVSGDLTARFGPETLDVTDLRFSDGEFDAVICNHVLEHVPDDRRAMREIRRVLRPGGWAMLLVPDVSDATTAETPDITDPDELYRIYGQHDHVRAYGWDYLDRLRDAGLETEVLRLDEVLTAETIRACRLLKFGTVEPVFLAHPTPVPARIAAA
jgi:SAM-dependent methyltransferase